MSDQLTRIVFSKDRALQLEAFLRSYRDHVSPLGEVLVVTKFSSLRHGQAYLEVFNRLPFATCVVQSAPFKATLLSLLPTTGHVIFFVDDQVFIRPWHPITVSGLSLRLAPHLRYCYPMRCAQPTPRPTSGGDLFQWAWTTGQGDWGYPLSLDGHIFRSKDIRPLIEQCAFDSPNTLEAALQVYAPRFTRGVCYPQSKVVNIPWTRVQTDYNNRFGGLSAQALLGHWEAGWRIDLSRIYGVVNESCHQEFPLRLESRPAMGA